MRTYGSVKLKDDVWRVEGEPHVIMRMKRLFAKSDKSQVGLLALSNTPENCRDLLWFLDRYAMEIHPKTLKKLKDGSHQYAENILLLEKILAGNYKARKVDMAIPARDYQKVGAELYLRKKSLLIGDDLGTGKTGLAIYSLLEPDTLPAAVVTLTHLPKQWQAEINKFTPGLRTHVIKTGKPYELKDKKTGLLPDVVILNYHKAGGWATTLAKYVNSVIFDECQELRHSGSGKYYGCDIIARAAKYRLGLSATPVFNYGAEMFNVNEVLCPGELGTATEFYREWACGEKGKILNPKAFGSFLREKHVMLRRTRKDVGREIPPINKVEHMIDSDVRALNEISGTAAELAKIILSSVPAERGDAFEASGRFEQVLRQATGIAKAPFVADFVRMIVESGESVLLFGWHHAVYDIWREKLADLNPVFFTGEETVAQKEEAKRKFIAKESPILVMSLRAGAGIDGLQSACNVCVFGELDWAAGQIEQDIGRIARDGQKDPVFAYFLVSEEGSDPVMIDILGIKTQQVEGIRNPESDIIERIQSTGDHVKKLAEHYLKKMKAVPQYAEVEF